MAQKIYTWDASVLSSGLRRTWLRRRLERPESSGGVGGGERPVLSWVILEHDDEVQSHRRRKRRWQGPVKHWSRVQRLEGPGVEGRRGHRSPPCPNRSCWRMYHR